MQAASEAEVEAPGVGLERSLGFHATDAPACMRRVNAQEVLSKKQADAVVSVAMPAQAEATNTRIVGGETPSVGGDAMRAMDPWWARTDTLVIMFNVEREARELDAFIASHTEGDATNAVLTVGNKSYGGFGDYGVTFSPILDPTVQRASTVLLKRKFFLAPSIRTNGITPIHTLERAVRNKIEMLAAERGQAMDLHLLQAHIIRQGCLLACWGAHVDNRGALKSANITAVTNLTEYETAMRVCGARSHADYSRQGDTAVFAADMWHYTSKASVGTIKLALFYSVRIRTNTCANASVPPKKRKDRIPPPPLQDPQVDLYSDTKD